MKERPDRMSGIGALRGAGVIAVRELRGSVFTPLGWIVMALFSLVQGYAFYLLVELAHQPGGPHGAVLRLFFGGTGLYWYALLFAVPTITMRSLAEERRSGTLEALLTAPISEWQIVFGKYLAAVGLYALLWLPTVAFVVALRLLVGPGVMDVGSVFAGYLGTLVVGAGAVSVGIMTSALSRHQILAALGCFTVLLLFLLVEPVAQYSQQSWVQGLARYLSLYGQIQSFAHGLVDTRPVVCQLSLATFCLVVATKALERRVGNS